MAALPTLPKSLLGERAALSVTEIVQLLRTVLRADPSDVAEALERLQQYCDALSLDIQGILSYIQSAIINPVSDESVTQFEALIPGASQSTGDFKGDHLSARIFGALGNVTEVSDAAMTAASPILTSASSRFTGADIGKRASVSGAGVAGASLPGTILAVIDLTHVTLSVSASTSVTNATLEYGTRDSVAIQIALTLTQALGHQPLLIPFGVYYVDGLTMGDHGLPVDSNGQSIYAEAGAVFKLTPSSNTFLLRVGTAAASEASSVGNSVRGLKFDGNKANNAASASPVLWLYNCLDSEMDVEVVDGARDNILVQSDSRDQTVFYSWRNRWLRIRTSGAVRDGVSLQNDVRFQIESLITKDNGRYNLNLNVAAGTIGFGTEDGSIGHIDCTGAGSHGVFVGAGCVRMSFGLGTIDKNAGYGVYFEPVSNLQENDGIGPFASEEFTFGELTSQDNALGNFYFGQNVNHILLNGVYHQPADDADAYGIWIDGANLIGINNNQWANFGGAIKITNTADQIASGINVRGGTADSMRRFLHIDSTAFSQCTNINVKDVIVSLCADGGAGHSVVLEGEMADVDIDCQFVEASDDLVLDASGMTYGGNALRFKNRRSFGRNLSITDMSQSVFGSDVWFTNAGGSCSVSGTAVTRLSGQGFTGHTGKIKITNVEYAIASVSDDDHLTLTAGAPSSGGTFWQFTPSSGLEYTNFVGAYKNASVTILNLFFDGVKIKHTSSLVLRDFLDFNMNPGESLTLFCYDVGVWTEVARTQGLTNAGIVRTTTDQTIGGSKTFSSMVKGDDGFSTNDTFVSNGYFGGSPANWRRRAIGTAYRLTRSEGNALSFDTAVSGAADSVITWVNILNLMDDGRIVAGAFTIPGTEVYRFVGTSQFEGDFTVVGSFFVNGTTALITAGGGTPEGVVVAPVASLFLRINGAAGTAIYIKESGSGNTGWIGINSANFFRYVTGSTTDVRTVSGITRIGVNMDPDGSTDLDVQGGFRAGTYRTYLTASRPMRVSASPQVFTTGPIVLDGGSTEVTGTLPVANGGTGGINATQAQTNLSVYSKSFIDTQKAAIDATDASLQSQIDSHSSSISTLAGELDALKLAYNLHTHGGVTTGTDSTGTTSNPA